MIYQNTVITDLDINFIRIDFVQVGLSFVNTLKGTGKLYIQTYRRLFSANWIERKAQKIRVYCESYSNTGKEFSFSQFSLEKWKPIQYFWDRRVYIRTWRYIFTVFCQYQSLRLGNKKFLHFYSTIAKLWEIISWQEIRAHFHLQQGNIGSMEWKNIIEDTKKTISFVWACSPDGWPNTA